MLVIDDGLGPIHLDQIGLEKWQLTEPFVYHTRKLYVIVVPAGFITDGCSSPSLFRGLIDRWGGHYSSAALVHDYLYECLDHGKPNAAAPTRREADDIFLEICLICHVNLWVACAMWLALRGLGGPGMRALGVRHD